MSARLVRVGSVAVCRLQCGSSESFAHDLPVVTNALCSAHVEQPLGHLWRAIHLAVLGRLCPNCPHALCSAAPVVTHAVLSTQVGGQFLNHFAGGHKVENGLERSWGA